MGCYLNRGFDGFMESLNDEIYVDKTEIIGILNGYIGTRHNFICITRPRRFGKSVTAEMLCAYYSQGVDSAPLFGLSLIHI